MITVNVIRSYEYPDFFRQSTNMMGRLGDVKFLLNSTEGSDFLICLNPPKQQISTCIPIERRWLFTQEPPVPQNQWFRNSFPYFGRVFTQFPGEDMIHSQTALPWHIQFNIDELENLKPPLKTKSISTITSNLNNLDGHIKRLAFLDYLQKNNVHLDFFGKGRNYLEKKEDGLLPYKYSICIENSFYPHYWTEKIADCFLCYTMPIYFGCPNILDYFPDGSYIQLDLTDFEKSKKLIIEAIEGNLWEKNFDKIKEARNLILHHCQFFPLVKNLINEHISSGVDKLNRPEIIPSFLPPNGSFKNMLKRKINHVREIFHHHLYS